MRYLEPESPTPATDKQSLKGVARVRTKSCVLCVVALAATPVSAITIRADRADSQYTSLGNDSKYKSVGYLSTEHKEIFNSMQGPDLTWVRL